MNQKEKESITLEAYEGFIYREFRVVVAENIAVLVTSKAKAQELIGNMVDDESRFPELDAKFPENENAPRGGFVMEVEHLGSHFEEVVD